jgi:hypothetical protein
MALSPRMMRRCTMYEAVVGCEKQQNVHITWYLVLYFPPLIRLRQRQGCRESERDFVIVSPDWLPGKIIPKRATPKYLTASGPVFRPRSSALAKFPGSQLRWKGFPVITRSGNRQMSQERAAPSGVTRLTASRYL